MCSSQCTLYYFFHFTTFLRYCCADVPPLTTYTASAGADDEHEPQVCVHSVCVRGPPDHQRGISFLIRWQEVTKRFLVTDSRFLVSDSRFLVTSCHRRLQSVNPSLYPGRKIICQKTNYKYVTRIFFFSIFLINFFSRSDLNFFSRSDFFLF